MPTPKKFDAKKRKSKSLRTSAASRKSRTSAASRKKKSRAARAAKAAKTARTAKVKGGGNENSGFNENSVFSNSVNDNRGKANSGYSKYGSTSNYGSTGSTSNYGSVSSNMNTSSNNSQSMNNNFFDPHLFTPDIVKEYKKYFVDSPPPSIFFKKNVGFGWKTILDGLPCQDYRDYMKQSLYNKIKRDFIDYAFMSTNGRITAIIFAELGECTEYPTFWTVRLICGSAGNKDARTLLGLYLFALKSIQQPIGMLEVAYSYKNLTAYCLYAKFGFDDAYKFKDFEGCETFDNIPMLRSMSDITKKDIVAIVQDKLVLPENKLCIKPINRAAQNKRVRKVLLPRWDSAGFNTTDFYYN